MRALGAAGLARLGLGVLALLLASAGCSDGAGGPDGGGADGGRRRVLLVGIDGAEPDLVRPMMAAGRLPNLSALASRGVSGTIRSLQPIDSPRIWNTIATGKSPAKHGILHFAHEGEGGGKKLYLSSDRKVHAIWNIVSDAGGRVGVVNFWNTYPPEIVNGVMISDHLMARNIEGRRRLTRAGEVPPGPVVHPGSWSDRIAGLLEDGAAPTAFANPMRDNPDLPRYLVLVGNDLPRRFDEDGLLARIALEIEDEIDPDLLMVLLPGIDRMSHFLWGSLQADQGIYPEELRVSEREQRGGRTALETYYEFTDALVGLLAARYSRDDLVIVLSDHGFETGRGMGLLTGIHESEEAVDGVFFAAGAGIAPGAGAGGISVEDVTPTILAWLGLPVGEDMDGRVAGFLAGVVPATVPTHDTAPVARLALRPSGAEDEIVDQLRQLGYLE